MAIWLYKITRDYGFAPNPFRGVCTLACCKPTIRKGAKCGDWVVGMGSKTNKMHGKIIYAMIVDKTLSFDQYWKHQEFQKKKVALEGTHKKFFGDNIYEWDSNKKSYIQHNSHHSNSDGSKRIGNYNTDTRVDRVLIGSKFIYFGTKAKRVPEHITNEIDKFFGKDANVRDCLKNISKAQEEIIKNWIESYKWEGLKGLPGAWKNAIEKRDEEQMMANMAVTSFMD